MRSFLYALLLLALLPASALAADRPSRPAIGGCKWEKFSDAALGLEAWVQRCQFDSRRTDFVRKGSTLAMRYSDSDKPETVIEVFDLQPNESIENGLRRVFAAHTDAKLARRCVLAPARDVKQRPGVKRYHFVPDAAFQKELDKIPSDGIPDPPCGDYGLPTDSVEYWEAHPSSAARKVLYIHVGQDDPLFDEETLRLLPEKRK